MASMSYCRWQNIREDLSDAMGAFYDGKSLNDDEKIAMKDCVEMFATLLQQHGQFSIKGYEEVDSALMNIYDEIDECEDEDD